MHSVGLALRSAVRGRMGVTRRGCCAEGSWGIVVGFYIRVSDMVTELYP